MELLRIEGAGKRFGDFVAVNRVSLTLPAGRLTAIIGPNGAGKTTLINLATGAVFPDSGVLRFKGEDITRLAIHHRIRKGLSRSFQIMNIFARLSVLQNILLPVLARRGRTAIPFHGRSCARSASLATSTIRPALSRTVTSGSWSWESQLPLRPNSVSSTSLRPG
jgi:branched-chain amino acid transport system ATP-binding protein